MSQPILSVREVSYEAGSKACRSSFVVDTRTAGKKPGVLVFPEFWGLNDYARSRAKMLAEQGYAAMAVDVYGDGLQAADKDQAVAQMTALMSDPAVTSARIMDALDALNSQPEVDGSRVAAIGYCMGGALALRAARLGLELRAVASFHGILASPVQAAPGKVKAGVLVCHGGADPLVPAESVTAFHAEMKAAGVDYELIAYPGVLHGFTEPEADARAKKYGLPLGYNAKADRASWASLLTLLSRRLDG